MNLHKNDHGLEVGDQAAFLAYGWIRVPCTIIAKGGSGFTRYAKVEYDDPKTSRSRSFGSTWATGSDWDRVSHVSMKNLEPW
jgi:hypothetical protein